MTKARLAVAGLLALLVVGFFAAGGHEALGFESLKARQEEIEALYRARPFATLAGFFGLYVLLATTSLPGGAVLTMVAGAIFGFVPAIFVVSFASTLGATFAMLISRYLLREWVEQRFGPRLRKLDAGIEREGASYLFLLRLVPAIPFFLVNVGMGPTRFPTWKYYWVSQLGMLPGSVLFANAGRRLAEMNSPDDVLSPGIVIAFVLLAVVPIAVKRILERKRKSGPEPGL